jgi:omega-amidase
MIKNGFMSDLRVCLVQADLIWQNKTENLNLLYAMLKSVVAVDLIVLPEMFSTGFTMNAKDYATSVEGEAVQWMKQLAKEKNACIVGSLIIAEDGKYFNRLFWITYNRLIFTIK